MPPIQLNKRRDGPASWERAIDQRNSRLNATAKRQRGYPRNSSEPRA